MSAAPVVSAGPVKFSNDLPISIIAGPCRLESRAHALEVASALKEIAGRLGVGLVYKTSFDKANRSSGSAPRGIGLAQALPIFAEIRSSLGLPCSPMSTTPRNAPRWRRRRCAADSGISVPADRPVAGGGSDRQGRQRQEGAVSGALGHGQCRRKITARAIRTCWSPSAARRSATTAGIGHAGAAILARTTGAPVIFDATHSVQQPGGKGTSSGGEANSSLCWRRRGRGRRRRRIHRNPPGS